MVTIFSKFSIPRGLAWTTAGLLPTDHSNKSREPEKIKPKIKYKREKSLEKRYSRKSGDTEKEKDEDEEMVVDEYEETDEDEDVV